MDIRNLSSQLHGGGNHVHALLPIPQGEEYVAQQDQGTAGQPVQVLSICHLEGLSKVVLALPILSCKKGFQAVDLICSRLHAVA